MKITKATLKQIIKEEVVKLLIEQDEYDDYDYEEEEEELTYAQKIIRLLSSPDPGTFAQGLEVYLLFKDDIEASDPAGNNQILEKLRVIDQFARSPDIQNVNFLSGLSVLNVTEKIILEGCKSLQNVDGLQGLTNLWRLDLGFCNSLENVDGLEGLTNLTWLDLSWCESLENVDGLQGLTNLRTLYLIGCESLPPELQELFITDSSGTAHEQFMKALNAPKRNSL